MNRLTGRDPCEDLTVTQLAELCKTINKASRKLAVEQAIREVRAQQEPQQNSSRSSSSKMVVGGLVKAEGSEKCLVCFENAW